MHLGTTVDGRLFSPESPLRACNEPVDLQQCDALFRELKNPYFIGDTPALTQTCGWVGAWESQPSAYVVAAQERRHVAAAVNFARARKLRLVVRGGGHSYLGTSTAPDSLMIWTRGMRDIVVHDAFVPTGCGPDASPVQAVSVGSGAIWMHTYEAVTGAAGRYVQGGGCGTVGVAGLIQGGGFGTYSKQFGIAAASLLEAEVVTADGAVRTVNACSEPELFWALKGGGGGTFGVVTRLTLRTHDLPAVIGYVSSTVKANSDAAYRRLVTRFVSFYAASLCNGHWGELVTLLPGNRLQIGMNSQGLTREEVAQLWEPFWSWIRLQDDMTMTAPAIVSGPGRARWNGKAIEKVLPGVVLFDDRPGAPNTNFFWQANLAEAGHVLHAFESLWLPAALLEASQQPALVDALVDASRHWTIELHFQKGLAGAPSNVIAAAADTPMNAAVLRSFALAIVASEGPPAFDGLPGHEPNLAKARQDVARIAKAMEQLRTVVPDNGAYVAESSYFQRDWQHAYWGDNYPRLLRIKQKYDPDGLFFVRHGVGSEMWSDDGFVRRNHPLPAM
ncbi:FAD-binding oxidoreductase [Paraburkholderia sp. HP33-1]|uniref:FAD-binding oxidoreductase n=1 Tax=Paraburkholderia sp. HP33-1 TaxID=2883243 RepID=UPI001F3BE54A|nr:FAD-binding protein [Paraburkholderia sp. HP33-1]